MGNSPEGFDWDDPKTSFLEHAASLDDINSQKTAENPKLKSKLQQSARTFIDLLEFDDPINLEEPDFDKSSKMRKFLAERLGLSEKEIPYEESIDSEDDIGGCVIRAAAVAKYFSEEYGIPPHELEVWLIVLESSEPGNGYLPFQMEEEGAEWRHHALTVHKPEIGDKYAFDLEDLNRWGEPFNKLDELLDAVPLYQAMVESTEHLNANITAIRIPFTAIADGDLLMQHSFRYSDLAQAYKK